MRGAGVCWSCSIALAAAWVRGSRATAAEGDEIEDSKAQPRRKTLPVYGARVNKAAQQAMAQKLRSVPISRERATATSDHPKITEAAALGKGKLGLTRWDKLPEGIVGRKRDATVCPADYRLCPASLSGGCCPSNSACDVSSCIPNTAAPGTACGRASYIPCGLDVGGGCCPLHYICLPNGDCTPSPGFSTTASLGTTNGILYTSCPSHFGGNSCLASLGCASSGCYTTTPVPFTLTETFTTTDVYGATTTSTTTLTSSRISGAPTSTPTDSGAIVPKIWLPSSTSSIPNNTPSTSGLSKPMIGGIIGGAGFLLCLILVVAFCILRRLKRTIKVTEKASRSRLRSNTNSNSAPRPPRPDMDTMSIDPLMFSPSSGVSAHWRRPSESERGLHTSTHEVDAPHIPRSLPGSHNAFGLPSTEAKVLVYNSRTNAYEYQTPHTGENTGSNYSSSRNPSLDSTPPFQNRQQNFNPDSAQGYFDIIHQTTPTSPRRPSHGRQWSNSSTRSDDLSSGMGSPPLELRSELEGDSNPTSPTSPATQKKPSGFGKVLMGLGMGRARRTRNEPPPQMRERRNSKEKVQTVLTGGPVRDRKHRIALGYIEEAGESRVDVGGGDMGMVKGHMREISETVLLDGNGR